MVFDVLFDSDSLIRIGINQTWILPVKKVNENIESYYIPIFWFAFLTTVMCCCHLGGYVLRNALLGNLIPVNIIKCIYANLGGVACYTPRLYGVAYSS